MFSACVNTLCINTVFTAPRIRLMTAAPIHAATERIYQAAQIRLKLRERPKPSQVANEVNISQQVLKHWEKRGPSKVGLIEWQLAKGVNATWIIMGKGPMFIPGRTYDPVVHANEPAAPWRAGPFTDEVRRALAELDTVEMRRIENSVRGFLDLPPLPAAGNQAAA
jgi:hypothetical protein